LKKRDFVVWRYHDTYVDGKLRTFFGVMEKEDFFHYEIRNLETGKVEKIFQADISIVYDKKYKDIYKLDRDTIYSRKELEDIFGEDDILDIKKYLCK